MDALEEKSELVIRINKSEAYQAFDALKKRKARKYRKFIIKRLSKLKNILKNVEEKEEGAKALMEEINKAEISPLNIKLIDFGLILNRFLQWFNKNIRNEEIFPRQSKKKKLQGRLTAIWKAICRCLICEGSKSDELLPKPASETNPRPQKPVSKQETIVKAEIPPLVNQPSQNTVTIKIGPLLPTVEEPKIHSTKISFPKEILGEQPVVVKENKEKKKREPKEKIYYEDAQGPSVEGEGSVVKKSKPNEIEGAVVTADGKIKIKKVLTPKVSLSSTGDGDLIRSKSVLIEETRNEDKQIDKFVELGKIINRDIDELRIKEKSEKMLNGDKIAEDQRRKEREEMNKLESNEIQRTEKEAGSILSNNRESSISFSIASNNSKSKNPKRNKVNFFGESTDEEEEEIDNRMDIECEGNEKLFRDQEETVLESVYKSNLTSSFSVLQKVTEIPYMLNPPDQYKDITVKGFSVEDFSVFYLFEMDEYNNREFERIKKELKEKYPNGQKHLPTSRVLMKRMTVLPEWKSEINIKNYVKIRISLNISRKSPENKEDNKLIFKNNVNVFSLREFNGLGLQKLYEDEILSRYGLGLTLNHHKKKKGKHLIYSELNSKALVPDSSDGRINERSHIPCAGIYYCSQATRDIDHQGRSYLSKITIWTTFTDLSTLSIEVGNRRII